VVRQQRNADAQRFIVTNQNIGYKWEYYSEGMMDHLCAAGSICVPLA